MDFNDVMLERNAEFADTAFSAELKMMPSTGTVIVGCVDPRVDPVHVLVGDLLHVIQPLPLVVF